jgi:hypothetical protein
MTGMKDLMREYERVRFPPDRRLDLQAEGPGAARERALAWIQSRAHEAPGQELLLIAARGVRPGAQPGAVEDSLRKLLNDLQGRLIDWWQPFAPGSLALRIATQPTMLPRSRPLAKEVGDGRTQETAGAARPSPLDDIPPELLDLARRATALRIEREGLSIRIEEVVLREVWIEVQARAMDRRTSFEAALDALYREELGRAGYEDRD